jgi:hypothetical protein
MTAPVGEVLRRAERLARLKRAGVPEPIRFVRSERQTREAVAAVRRAAVPSPAAGPGAPICPWCGRTEPCADHRDLDGQQPWL